MQPPAGKNAADSAWAARKPAAEKEREAAQYKISRDVRSQVLLPPTNLHPANHVSSQLLSSTSQPYKLQFMNGIDLNEIPDAFLGYAWSQLSPRDRVKALAGASRTLWLFGAGASYHYDLNIRNVPVPLASGFFEAFNRLPTSSGFNAHVGPLILYLGEYRGILPNEVSKWTENIEMFMTSLEKELLTIKAKKGKRSKDDSSRIFSLAPTINNMTFIFANVINEAQNGPSESLYTYLLESCGPNDTFVTFNWDTLLDRALASTGGWSPDDGYGLSFTATMDGAWRKRLAERAAFKTNWRLLKLHGSTNWLVPYTYIDFQTLEFLKTVPRSDRIFLYWQATLPFKTHNSRWRGGYVPTTYGYYPPNIPGKFFPKQHLKAKPGHVFVRINPMGIFSPFKEPAADGVPASPLLITPVKQKRYEDYSSSIEKLWANTERSIKDAVRIVVIGYSFPETDVRAMKMLRTVLAQRKGEVELQIVAPDAEQIADRIGALHLKKAKADGIFAGKFEDYMDVLSQGFPSLMREAAAKNNEIRDWVIRLFVMNTFALVGAKRNY